MTKSITLTQGKLALVDDEDFEKLNKYKWYFHGGKYAVRNSRTLFGKRKTIHMHHEIVDTPAGMQVDHINLDSLDNRKQNLRLCTHSENQHNQGLYKNNTSGFKGVVWHKVAQKWSAKIGINGRRVSLGYFETPEDAARAYDDAAKKHHGEFARTNIKVEVQ